MIRSSHIKLGQHLSPRTEFKAGGPAHNKLPVGTVTVRVHNGSRRAFVKITEPSVWRERAKVVWESQHGKRLPRGYVVHHKDRDPLNDAPSNLVALTRKQHVEAHRDDLNQSRTPASFARAWQTRRQKGLRP